MGSPKTIPPAETAAALQRLASGILARHGDARGKTFWLLGIANGGIRLAAQLAEKLKAGGLPVATGSVDISFHRDDIGNHPIPKEFMGTQLPGDVTGASIILVDDVLYTGRSVKAALDELFDHGRPGRVELAVIADRAGRLLPIAADYVGLTVAAAPDEDVRVLLDA